MRSPDLLQREKKPMIFLDISSGNNYNSLLFEQIAFSKQWIYIGIQDASLVIFYGQVC